MLSAPTFFTTQLRSSQQTTGSFSNKQILTAATGVLIKVRMAEYFFHESVSL